MFVNYIYNALQNTSQKAEKTMIAMIVSGKSNHNCKRELLNKKWLDNMMISLPHSSEVIHHQFDIERKCWSERKRKNFAHGPSEKPALKYTQ